MSTLGDVTVLAVNQPIDAGFRTTLFEAVRQSPIGGNVVVDMDGLESIDSMALGYLITAHNTLKAKQGQLVIAGPSAEIREVFEITRVIQLFKVFDCRESALESFGG